MKGPNEIRLQLAINNTTLKDLQEISELLTEKQNSLLTLNQIFPREILHKVYIIRPLRIAPT